MNLLLSKSEFDMMRTAVPGTIVRWAGACDVLLIVSICVRGQDDPENVHGCDAIETLELTTVSTSVTTPYLERNVYHLSSLSDEEFERSYGQSDFFEFYVFDDEQGDTEEAS